MALQEEQKASRRARQDLLDENQLLRCLSWAWGWGWVWVDWSGLVWVVRKWLVVWLIGFCRSVEEVSRATRSTSPKNSQPQGAAALLPTAAAVPGGGLAGGRSFKAQLECQPRTFC